VGVQVGKVVFGEVCFLQEKEVAGFENTFDILDEDRGTPAGRGDL
jgi:hypothetical protein